MKNQKQAQINPAEVEMSFCPKCNGNVFDKKYHAFRLSRLAPSNPTAKDLDFAQPAYLQCANPLCSHILEEVTPG